jgi:alpha-tubulin suppressor-like RCC1 family protein
VLGHDNGGSPPNSPGETPDLELGAPATQIAVGGLHSCALLDDGRVRCWGLNTHGQLGLGEAEPRDGNSIPDGEVSLGGPAVAIASGNDFSCALVSDGDEVRCWGHNNLGQLGLGHTDDIYDPSAVPAVVLPEVP